MLFVTAVITTYTLTMVMLVSALVPGVCPLCLAASGCSANVLCMHQTKLTSIHCLVVGESVVDMGH